MIVFSEVLKVFQECIFPLSLELQPSLAGLEFIIAVDFSLDCVKSLRF